MTKDNKTIIIFALLILFFNINLSACPVCYGASDSPMTDGMNKAIIAMLGITGFVLTGISSFFFMMIKKIKSKKNYYSLC